MQRLHEQLRLRLINAAQKRQTQGMKNTDIKPATAGPIGVSSPVRSGQKLADPAIAERMQRRALSVYQRPIAEHSERAFSALAEWRQAHLGEMVLDTGCGNGESSLALSERYPDAWIVGIDKTLDRLAKRGYRPDNGPVHMDQRCCFLLADLVDLWRLMAAAGWRFRKQYVLYPNPWPKPAQRLRRWPLHPVWPDLLQMSDQIELRTNWSVYAEEFEQSLNLSGWASERTQLAKQDRPITPFEAKYQASEHTLWQVVGRAKGP